MTTLTRLPSGIEIVGEGGPAAGDVLTPDALAFAAHLQRSFNELREDHIQRRQDRQAELDAGVLPDFPIARRKTHESEWSVAPTPPDLEDRRVEITGPAEPKMMINALNSGAKVFMADLEDALSPTWPNVVSGHAAIRDAVRGQLAFTSPEGKAYSLNENLATLVVRPRGLHLVERHVRVDGTPVSASLFDFGIDFFWNAAERLSRGSGPYYYLPKLQSRWEARLWNQVFVAAQNALGIPRGSVRATVLVETIHAAFEMDDILWELREHAAGLNAGRWDYLFSVIKSFHAFPERVLPDRAQLTMRVPFMRAYTELLVRTCHRRGAHAIGGMAAYIPSRRDAAVNDTAMGKVREDKERESGDGFDGTWVAHPDLVPLATEVFDGVLGERSHQKDRLREDASVTADQLLDFSVPDGRVTEAGVRQNISVALRYLDSWLRGNGAAAIDNLMEDAATAEIARSQLWQWRAHGTSLDDAAPLTAERYLAIRGEELERVGGVREGRLGEAAELLDSLVLADDFPEFLTLPAYAVLD
jgi:malate synthase